MKHLILTIIGLLSILSFAVTVEEAVAASGWTVEELVTALNLMEAKYNREVATAAGRTAWHGRKVGETVDTNTMTKVSLYEDGMTFTDAARIMTAQDSVNAYNSKLPRPAMTNGVPARLAAARLRRQAELQAVSNVTITVTAGGGKE